MKVVNRAGLYEDCSFNEVLYRIKKLANNKELGKLNNIDVDIIAKKTIECIYDGIKTTDLDDISSKIAISMSSIHPEYTDLASRIAVSNLHKNTTNSFFECITLLYNNSNDQGENFPLVSKKLYNFVKKNKKKLDNYIIHSRDYLFDYFGFKTLESKYLLKIYIGKNENKVIERPQFMWLRVALGIHLGDLEKILETYNLLSQFYFTHASPTLFNAGTPTAQYSSCYLLGTDDSMIGIYKTISDCAVISKYSGGIGVHISNIRSSGSIIKGSGGKSDGILPMLKVYNATSRYSNQSGKRLGSFAIYIEPWHADIMEFLEMKKNVGDENLRARDLFYALWIPDNFMRAVKNNEDWYLMSEDSCPNLSNTYGKEFEDLYNSYVKEERYRKKIKAEEVWEKILVSQIETGTPYMMFKDAVNNKSNQKHYGTIKSSNLCVAPETMILTSKGYYPIFELENQEVEVWNGFEFSKTTIYKTGENKELMKVYVSNGSEIYTTPYHKFYIETGTRPNEKSKVKIVEAQDLEKGMKIIKCNFPVIDGEKELENAYTNGIFSAEGTYRNYKIPILYLYDEKMKLVNYISCKFAPKYNHKYNRIYCRLVDTIEDKYFVPINYSIKSKLEWLAGYIDGDGCIVKNQNVKALQVCSINKDFLEKVKYLLQTLGCDPKIRILKEEGQKLFPDSNKNPKYYTCKKCYRLLLNSSNLYKLCRLGLSCKRLDTSNLRNYRNCSKYLTIEKVECIKRISDTFCFNETKRHSGIFNGVITSQCAEITLYSDNKEYAVCNIATLSLPKYLEKDEKGKLFYNYQKLYDVTKVITKNLNNIIDINFYPTKETEISNKRHRPIAIGIQGLANLLYLLKYPFDSQEAKDINKKIMETIYFSSLNASMELAKEEGSYETFKGSPMSEGIFQHNMWGINNNELSGMWDWDTLKENVVKYGLRNSLLTSLPPTASTSQILGNYEAFEIPTNNFFMRETLSGNFPVVNKYLINDLIELKLWSNEIKDKIILDNGSIQNIKEIPENIKKLYRTVWEYSQKVVIDLSADRAIFIDHSQSLNIFMKTPTIAKLTSSHFYAWEKGLKTGSYYIRSQPKSQAQKFSVSTPTEKLVCSLVNRENCEACSG